MAVFGFIGGYVAHLAAKCVSALLLACVARTYSSAKERNIDFWMGWRLGLHAMTVAVGIQVVELLLLPKTSSMSMQFVFTASFWAVSCGYLTKGLEAVWESTSIGCKQEPVAPPVGGME